MFLEYPRIPAVYLLTISLLYIWFFCTNKYESLPPYRSLFISLPTSIPVVALHPQCSPKNFIVTIFEAMLGASVPFKLEVHLFW